MTVSDNKPLMLLFFVKGTQPKGIAKQQHGSRNLMMKIAEDIAIIKKSLNKIQEKSELIKIANDVDGQDYSTRKARK